jgi:DNA-binding transcriptional MerR regulator
MPDVITLKKFLTIKEVATLLAIPEGTLRKWRRLGVGPRWRKVRKV